ncbi:hypothetical protein [Micromonospora sp. URMC 103]|uniref:hypothetical protein n=1 Tax=Micromonospora sp. URMC 103 TaxID=3423406 RepID=UPI003F1970E3
MKNHYSDVLAALSLDFKLTANHLANLTPDEIRELGQALETIARLSRIARGEVAR